MTSAAQKSKTSVDELLNLLAAETKAPGWPNVLSSTSTKAPRPKAPVVNIETDNNVSASEDLKGIFKLYPILEAIQTNCTS